MKEQYRRDRDKVASCIVVRPALVASVVLLLACFQSETETGAWLYSRDESTVEQIWTREGGSKGARKAGSGGLDVGCGCGFRHRVGWGVVIGCMVVMVCIRGV